MFCSLDSANAKLTGLVNLVKKVNGRGTQLIDGIGTQAHLSVSVSDWPFVIMSLTLYHRPDKLVVFPLL